MDVADLLGHVVALEQSVIVVDPEGSDYEDELNQSITTSTTSTYPTLDDEENDSAVFGHGAEPPRVALHRVKAAPTQNSQPLLVVAYTRHCVALQVYLETTNTRGEATAAPHNELPAPPPTSTTTATSRRSSSTSTTKTTSHSPVVSLGSIPATRRYDVESPSDDDDDNDNNDEPEKSPEKIPMDTARRLLLVDDEIHCVTIVQLEQATNVWYNLPEQSLLYGESTGPPPQHYRVAILVGTKRSRLLVAELTLLGTFQDNSNPTNLLQPSVLENLAGTQIFQWMDPEDGPPPLPTTAQQQQPEAVVMWTLECMSTSTRQRPPSPTPSSSSMLLTPTSATGPTEFFPRTSLDSGSPAPARLQFFWEVLPEDDEWVAELLHRKSRKAKVHSPHAFNMQRQQQYEPFQPSQGVISLTSFSVRVQDKEEYTTYVWIAYRDGTMVRMHHAAVFPSLWAKGAQSATTMDYLLHQVHHAAVVRTKLHLTREEQEHIRVLCPLPKHHSSPLTPVPLNGHPQSALAVPETHEALVFASEATSDRFPTLVLYSSENHFWEPPALANSPLSAGAKSSEPDVVGAVLGGTKAIVGGVFGAFRWAVTGTVMEGPAARMEGLVHHNNHNNHNNVIHPQANPAHMEDLDDQPLPESPFPSLWDAPISLRAALEFHDMPRKIEQASIDPKGRWAALADGLGRVILWDLQAKQVTRLWKGMRDATCLWMDVPSSATKQSSSSSTRTYLVIHCRHRRVVEVWPPRFGPRLLLQQVPRDAVLVPCHATHSAYILESPHPGGAVRRDDDEEEGGPLNPMERLELLLPDDNKNSTRNTSANATPSSREATLRVQQLQQLLSMGDKITSSATDVYKAFCRIQDLRDVALCLDLVVTNTALTRTPFEETSTNMAASGVLRNDGSSSFAKQLLEHAKHVVEVQAMSDDEKEHPGGSGMALLKHKIQFYTQVIKAFDLLHGYELKVDQQPGSNLSAASREALGWAETFQVVSGTTMDSLLRTTTPENAPPPLIFSKFAAACVLPSIDSSDAATKTPTRSLFAACTSSTTNATLSIYFSESSRTRQEILLHVFNPLLSWFSTPVVTAVFEALGIRDNHSYLLKCFAEWFLTLRQAQIENQFLRIADPSMSRFVREVVLREMETNINGVIERPESPSALLRVCHEATDLVRAMVLATLGRDVIARVFKQKEKTEGSAEALTPLKKHWEAVIRKLRVLLLVSLRLYNKDLAPFPLSVRAVETEGGFSVSRWLALDEIAMFQTEEEILALEKACTLSTHKFNAFAHEADCTAKFQALQHACKAMGSKSLTTEVSTDGTQGSLLLFLYPHADPCGLAAHRALLQAVQWIRQPMHLDMLGNAINALKTLSSTQSPAMAHAIRLEVWNQVISPVYRARTFGLPEDDAAAFIEDSFADVFENREWLTGFGQKALEVLRLVGETAWTTEKDMTKIVAVSTKREVWPPLETDRLLQAVLSKSRPVEPNAITLHEVVISCLLFSDDLERIATCVPVIQNCFAAGALFEPTAPVSPTVSESRESFLSDAIVTFAQGFDGGVMDSFAPLRELEMLCSRWSIETKWLRTKFLIVMYEIGKDENIDELVTMSASQILPQQMLVGGLNVVCRRLYRVLRSVRSQTVEKRQVLGLLDADLCDWIRRRAESSTPLVALSDFENDVPLETTQLLSLRILSLGASSNCEPSLRSRIHALAVLCGTLVNSLETI